MIPALGCSANLKHQGQNQWPSLDPEVVSGPLVPSVGVPDRGTSAQPLRAHPSPTGPLTGLLHHSPNTFPLASYPPPRPRLQGYPHRISHPDLSHKLKPTIPRACWTHPSGYPTGTDTFTCEHQSSHFPCLPVNSFSRVPQLRADCPSSCPSQDVRTTLDYSFSLFISHLSPSLSLPGLGHWHLLSGQQQHSFPDGPRLHWNLSPHCNPGVFSPKHKYAMQSFSCLNKFKWTR